MYLFQPVTEYGHGGSKWLWAHGWDWVCRRIKPFDETHFSAASTQPSCSFRFSTGSTAWDRSLVISPIEFWPPFAGVVFLVAGLVTFRQELTASRGFDRLIGLAAVLYAAPLAVFGAEHLVIPQDIMQGVPVWMPWRLFWAYFVGIALIAAALSIIAKRYVTLSATLLAAMILLFVLMIHLPEVIRDPGNRIFWVIAVRDTAFSAGALILAVTQWKERRASGANTLLFAGRCVIALALIFFGIEHFLHPEFAPGVPLAKMTPAWVPLGRLWGYLSGAILLVAGAAMLFNKLTRVAAISAGAVMILITLFLYLPIALMASGPSAILEGVNYVADTLFFAGTALLLACASRGREPAPSKSSSALRA